MAETCPWVAPVAPDAEVANFGLNWRNLAFSLLPPIQLITPILALAIVPRNLLVNLQVRKQIDVL